MSVKSLAYLLILLAVLQSHLTSHLTTHLTTVGWATPQPPSKLVNDQKASEPSEGQLPNASPNTSSNTFLSETQSSKAFSNPLEFIDSEQIISTENLWKEAGLRIDLAYYEASVNGFSKVPSGFIQGVHIGLGTRLDHRWSLDGVLRYGIGKSGLGGLNFSGLLSPTYHKYGFGLGLGVGVIGVSEQPNTRRDPYPELSSEVVASYTLPDGSTPLSSCVGFGSMVALSTLYRFPISTTFAIKLGAQIDLARLACEQDTDRIEPDTAQGIVIRQYWERWSWSMFGGLSWR